MVTDRRQRRSKEAIEAAALALFSERGYAGVGIDEIGSRAGVSGPAVYQYFKSKRALLAAVLEPGVAHTRRLAEAAITDAKTPRAALDALLQSYVTVGLDASDRFDLYFREEHNLPKDAQTRLRRETRLFVETWVAVLTELRPDLSDAECRVAVRSVISMVDAAVRASDDVPDDARARLIVQMSLAALTTKAKR
jgi:AcrR family transcriptional regulator